MDLNRRHLLSASVAGATGALAAPRDTLASSLGRDATQYGLRPGSPDDQTKNLQRAIDEAARAQAPLVLPPGVYRTGLLNLQKGTQLIGMRGATKLVFNGGASLSKQTKMNPPQTSALIGMSALSAFSKPFV